MPTPEVCSRCHSPTNHTGHPGGVDPSICDFHAKFGAAAHNCQALCLFAVPLENCPICSYGTCLIHLCFSGHAYCWTFIIADVKKPILGADFLCEHGLLVDLRQHCLVNVAAFSTIQGVQCSGTLLHIASASKPDEFTALMTAQPVLTTPSFNAPEPKHGVFHHIETTGPPISCCVRHLAPDKLAAAKAEFDHMETMGIVQWSNSPCASPLHVVPKSDDSWQPCGDYRQGDRVPWSPPHTIWNCAPARKSLCISISR